MRYSGSLPSGGRSRTILYCQDDGGMPLRPGLKSTTCPTLNLCCRTRFVDGCIIVLPTPLVKSAPERRKDSHAVATLKPELAARNTPIVSGPGRSHSDARLRFVRRAYNHHHTPRLRGGHVISRSACNHSRSSPYCSGRCDPWWAAPSLLVGTLAASPAKCLTRTRVARAMREPNWPAFAHATKRLLRL
jgi:hypothetical protein